MPPTGFDTVRVHNTFESFVGVECTSTILCCGEQGYDILHEVVLNPKLMGHVEEHKTQQ